MLERFSDHARRTVVRAREEAVARHHGRIRTEHLLFALLELDDDRAVALLRSLGVDVAAVQADLVQRPDRQRVFTDRDDAALRAIGIDLDEVRRNVEASFGPGALDRHASRTERTTPGTRRLMMSPNARKALALAVRESRRLGAGTIGTEHLLLGLVRGKDCGAAVVLARHGIRLDDIDAAVQSTSAS